MSRSRADCYQRRRRLAAITGLPVVHLCPHYWLPEWVRPDSDTWRATVEAVRMFELKQALFIIVMTLITFAGIDVVSNRLRFGLIGRRIGAT